MKKVGMLVLLASLIGWGAVGCDALTNKTMGVGILTQMPDITDAGLIDQRLLSALGELPVEQAVVATVFVGERSSITEVVEPPTPVTGATIELQWAGKGVMIKEMGEGSYMAINGGIAGDSSTDFFTPGLEYAAGAPYSFMIDITGDTFQLPVTAPAAIETSKVSFSPALGTENITIPTQDPLTFATHPKSTDLTLAWESADPNKPQQAFVTIARIEYNGASDMSDALNASAWSASSNNPVYDNFPRDAEGFLSRVLDTPATQATVEGSVFTPGLYIVMLTVVELNTDNNMALGSAGIGGVATPFVFLVMP